LPFTDLHQLLANNAPDERPRWRASAWGISLCLHALAVATAASLLRDLPQLPPPTYRMELLLHESSNVADTPSARKNTAGAPQAAPAPAPAAAHPQREPASSNTQPVESPSNRQSSVIQQTLTRVTPVTRVTQNTLSPETVRTKTPVTPSQPIEQRIENSPAANESPALSPQPLPQMIERSFVPTTTHAVSTLATRQEVATERQERSTAQVQRQSMEPTDSAPTHSGQASASPQDADRAAVETDSPSADAAHRGSETEASIFSAHAGEARDPGDPDAPRAVVAMGHPAITRTISAGSDFGWLTDLLKRRIKSFQAYPRLAAMQGWEGKVVVQATIGPDGRLLSAVVIESSGFASLDQDALNLMHRATPIHFQQELGQSHIEVFIPVIYHLDR